MSRNEYLDYNTVGKNNQTSTTNESFWGENNKHQVKMKQLVSDVNNLSKEYEQRLHLH